MMSLFLHALIRITKAKVKVSMYVVKNNLILEDGNYSYINSMFQEHLHVLYLFCTIEIHFMSQLVLILGLRIFLNLTFQIILHL